MPGRDQSYNNQNLITIRTFAILYITLTCNLSEKKTSRVSLVAQLMKHIEEKHPFFLAHHCLSDYFLIKRKFHLFNMSVYLRVKRSNTWITSMLNRTIFKSRNDIMTFSLHASLVFFLFYFKQKFIKLKMRFGDIFISFTITCWGWSQFHGGIS